MLIAICLIICVIVGIILFLLSGVFYVKEGKVAVFEKLYKFYAYKGKGLYFFTPFLVRRVGYYSSTVERNKIKLKSSTVFITYKISDFFKYHYEGHCFKETLVEKIKEAENIEQNYQDITFSLASRFGVEIIDFRIIENASLNSD